MNGLHSIILGTVRGLLYVVILMGCVLPFLFSAIGKIIGMVPVLVLNFVSSTEHTSSPTLPSYQQRDNTLAPPPTDTNEEIELQSNPGTQI
ncbi:hypothetical protein SOMG_04922 [Schizosaccharomyces osmophilus]|uniref:Uncharacterized protein n=1 Tax=Schizosaccharomyces osmophilus TaxID=2545709 RepID=A0AAF0AZ86_9SCHI|nr:uncharacterized protein SOMG_04922 [Schizosaccharomyces osmophilus]WBW75575.1 hypothetical protein SOMG_04922 [Schizosaccharomyces osmophilus]